MRRSCAGWLAGALLALEASLCWAQAPVIQSLNANTLPRSGRLRVIGSNFGGLEGQVLVSGLPAIVTRWANTAIVAYVPEAAPLGNATVQVVNAYGSSNLAPLQVTLRQPDGHVRWRFEADVMNLWYRPALAPDGTIYLHGEEGRVYALAPDGGLKWIKRLESYPFPYVPPLAGPNGEVYVSSIATVTALFSDGNIHWQFTDPGAQGVHAGPVFGPDGNLYFCNDLGLGACKLTPSKGELLWSNAGEPLISFYGGDGAETVIGARQADDPPSQMYVASTPLFTDGSLYAFDLASGNQNWSIVYGWQDSPFTQLQTRPEVGPDGTIYLTHMKGGGYGWSLEAYSPVNGQSLWFLPGGGDLYPPAIGPDGRLYMTTMFNVKAVDPATHNVLWTYQDGWMTSWPTVSPLNDLLIVGGVKTFGDLGVIRAVSTSGTPLWSLTLPGAFYPAPRAVPVHRPRFTPDGSTAYVSTVMLAGDGNDPHSYLFALETGVSSVPGDIDGDGDVDQADLGILLAAFGTCAGDPGFNPAADIDGDGCVGQADLGSLLANFGM